MLDTFREIGQDMFVTGLVGTHTGTLSVRLDGKAVISRRGARLGRLIAEDLIEFDIDGELPEGVTDDAAVHQAIYRVTNALAVIHARPPATMALALAEDRLSPANGEGVESLGSAPVLISQRTLNSPDVAHIISRTLKENRVVALRGHGVFARGQDLSDALDVVSLLDEMCKVTQLFRTFGREEQQPVVRDWHERQAMVSGYRSKPDNLGPRRTPARPPTRGQSPSIPPRGGDTGPRRPPNEPRSGGNGTGGGNSGGGGGGGRRGGGRSQPGN